MGQGQSEDCIVQVGAMPRPEQCGILGLCAGGGDDNGACNAECLSEDGGG